MKYAIITLILSLIPLPLYLVLEKIINENVLVLLLFNLISGLIIGIINHKNKWNILIISIFLISVFIIVSTHKNDALWPVAILIGVISNLSQSVMFNTGFKIRRFLFVDKKGAQQVDAPEPAKMVSPASQHLSGRPGDL